MAALVVAGLTTGIAVSVAGNSVSAAQPVVSIYAKNVVPVVAAEKDPRSVEVGVQFSVRAPGAVVGLRYYKSAKNTGPHLGSLWTLTGTRLATASFTAKTRRGWQTVTFAKPVKLTPGRAYVASYHTSSGYYAQQEGAFTAGATLGNSIIRATRGRYAYGPGGFPTSSWHGSAYYVDVLFQTSGSATTPPSTSPAPVTTAPTPAKTSTKPPTPTTTPTPSKRPTKTPTTTPSPTKTPTSSRTTTTATPTPTRTTTPPPAKTPTPTPTTGGRPALTATAVPTPGQVGYLAASGGLKVVDSQASAPAGTSWSNTGLSIDSSVVLDHVYVKIGIQIYGSPTVTITDSVIEGSSPAWSPIFLQDSGATLKVSDSTVKWVGAPRVNDGNWGTGVVNGVGNVTLVRDDLSGNPDGVAVSGDHTLVSQCYIHALAALGQPPYDTHNDGLQVEGANIAVLYNRIDVGYDGLHQNSAVFLDGEDANPKVIGNYLSGGSFTLRLEDQVTGAVITGNTFGLLTNGAFGEATTRVASAIATWSANVDTNGKPVVQPTG